MKTMIELQRQWHKLERIQTVQCIGYRTLSQSKSPSQGC